MDALIFLGANFNERTSYLWDKTLLEKKKIAQIDSNLEQLQKVFKADVAITADIKTALTGVLSNLDIQGVDRSSALVDLSGEFERQFFGDVMLFTVIELLTEAYPVAMPDADRVSDIVHATQSRLRQAYATNQSRVLQS